VSRKDTLHQLRLPYSFAKFLVVIVLLNCVALQAQQGQQQASPLNSPAIESKVNALLKQMTLEEKVGQLNQYSAGAPTGPGTGRSDYVEMISKGEIGSLFNVKGAKDTNAFQRVALEKSRLKIPILFGLDVIHGYRTIFPVPLGMSATWNPDLVERAARLAAQETAAEGIRWTFSPMVDIARDARWGRITEGAGEDPYLGSLIAAAYIRGYQGKVGMPDTIAACAKHYVGYGAAEGGRDYNTTEISEHTLRQVYLPPFKATVDAGALTFMSAFNSINGVPASANRFTLRQILRKEWGFKGTVVSDWTSIAETIAHGTAIDGKAAARKSFLAGVDMDMESNLYHQYLAGLVKSGAIPQATLDESVRNVLRVKYALGLFDNPYTEEARTIYGGKPIPPASRELARDAAEESFVLLKNGSPHGQPVLPLQAGTAKTIALIGPLADDAGNMLGSWGADGKPEDVVTLRKALTEFAASNGIKVNFAQGTEIVGGTDAQTNEALEAARAADVVLLAVGEDAGLMTGEAGSRTRLELPGQQSRLVEQIAALGKPTVMIVFSGRPLALSYIEGKVNAILEAWFPGVEAGPALVRTLFGAVSPQGRLTASFPRYVGQEPLYYNALNTGRPVPPNIDLSKPTGSVPNDKYFSRYIDEQNAPAYPFGYGLTYTTFSYGAPKLSATSTSISSLGGGAGTIRVTAEVRNAGSRPGQETVQLYVGQRGTSVSLPVRELKGFQKVSLAPGESKTVEFTVGREQLSFWNIDNKFTVEPARVRVWVAPHSAAGEAVEFEIK
jgi:beta-glucosidase